MCDLDRRTFLKTASGAAVLAGEFVYGYHAHAQGQPLKIGAPLPFWLSAGRDVQDVLRSIKGGRS